MADTDNMVVKASQDLQTIEDFVNLPAGSDVRPRLLPSVNVGTLAGIRDAIFENGGLPATPFATKALMEASALVDGDYAMVTDDTVNNGLYVKTAEAWVKSAYDTASKKYVASNIDKAIARAAERFYSANAFEFVGIFSKDGVFQTTQMPTWRRTDYIPVTKGDVVIVNTSAESTQKQPAVTFFNANKEHYKFVIIENPTEGYKVFTSTADEDGYIIAQHASTGFEDSSVTINKGANFSYLGTKADKSVVNTYYDFTNGYVDDYGNEVVDDYYMRSAVYKVKPGTTIDIKRLDIRFWIGWGTSSTPIVKHEPLPNNEEWYKFTAPTSFTVTADEPYIRFFVRTISQKSPLDFDIKDLYEITSTDNVAYTSDVYDIHSKLNNIASSNQKDKIKIADGAYSWWNEPQSLSVPGLHPKSFVGVVDIQTGYSKSVSIDTSTSPILSKNTYLAASDYYVPDAHNAPVAVIADDKLCVFYCGHNDKNYLPYRCSSNMSQDGLGGELRINAPRGTVSYSQVHYNQANNTLYVFFRAGGDLGSVNHWYLATSTNWADESPSWEVSEVFKDTEQMYLRVVPTYDGSGFRCLLTKNAKFNEINGLWYAHISTSDGAITTAGGVSAGQVGAGAVVFAELTKIYSAPEKIRLYDAKTEQSILPILVQEFYTNEDGGDYKYLEYDLNTWAITKNVSIVHSGESLGANYYFGGVHFSNVTAMGNDLPTSETYTPIYTAREQDGISYIEEWVTTNMGASWNMSRVIDQSSEHRLWRPRVPFNFSVTPDTPNKVELTWCKGTWGGYTDYNAEVWALIR